ncbi:Kae1-associated kinase Bud32 [Candidatus Micrarchaeota archaeon]|nr:MAG: Kae1-associated kinase Bud32 [Candidatus Micrarchaeota archaeon]
MYGHWRGRWIYNSAEVVGALMKMIYKGAEAELYKSEYLGMPVVLKRRVKKRYRIEELDSKIRASRTKREVVNLIKAKKAVNTPYVYDVNMKAMEISMQFIEGPKLKEIIEEKEELSAELGKQVRAMHDINMIHGDLTTSNVIVSGGKLYFIDFGLAFFSDKTEDKAVDLQVFRDVLKSSHHRVWKKLWAAFCGGYADERVLEKLKEIDNRARYR